MNLWRRFVRVIFLTGLCFILVAPIVSLVVGIIFAHWVGWPGMFLSVTIYFWATIWQFDGTSDYSLSERVTQVNLWVRAGAKRAIPLKPPLDKQALYEAIIAHPILKHALDNDLKGLLQVGKLYKITLSYKKLGRVSYKCKLKYWWGWKKISSFYYCYLPPAQLRYKKKHNDQLVQLLELLTGEVSVTEKHTTVGEVIDKNCEYKQYKTTDRRASKMVEDAKYEIVNDGTETALIEATDKRRGKHVEAIKNRNEMVHTQMVELAKDLFTVSMYLKQRIVTIDNCKMAIEMVLGRESTVNMYLNKVDKNDKRMNWKDIMASMARDIKPVISSLRTTNDKKKRHLPFLKERSIQTSYSVTSEWSIIDKEFNRDFLKLLPTARMLVDEQLGQLHSETIADTEYLQVMFAETESELRE